MPGCGLVVIVFGLFLFSVVLLGLVVGLWIGDSWVVGLGRYCWLVCRVEVWDFDGSVVLVVGCI